MQRRLIQEIGILARETSHTIAVAESATGGMIASSLVSVAGSSDYFRGGIVAYHNEVKEQVLGVGHDTLVIHGAVSAEVAAQMAHGARQITGADIGVSDTGIAGPTGSTPGKPVGLFYIGLATANETKIQKHLFEGTRTQNRRNACLAVLTLLRDYLKELKSKIKEHHVVTCFLEHQGKIALLRRSQNVGTYQGKWAGVSGYIEAGRSPMEQAYVELSEEVHLGPEDVRLVSVGRAVSTVDKQLCRKWVVHPYRFWVSDISKIQIDWEHSELQWVDPRDLGKYDTVPILEEAWQQLLAPRAQRRSQQSQKKV